MPTHEYYLKHWEQYRTRRHSYYIANRDEALKSATEWQKSHPEAFAQIRDTYRRKHIDKIRAKVRLKRILEPEKEHTRNVARSLPLAESCEFCGSKERLEHHHPDYSEPYITVTACKDCHAVVNQNLFDAGITSNSEEQA